VDCNNLHDVASVSRSLLSSSFQRNIISIIISDHLNRTTTNPGTMSTRSPPPPPLLRLPTDLLIAIVSHLPPGDHLAFLRTCRFLHAVLLPSYHTSSVRYPAALLHAVTYNLPSLALSLLQAGASPEVYDRHGISALEHAARHGSNGIITSLLAAGARLELKKGGRQPYPLFSPLDLAAKSGHVATLALLVPELRRRYAAPEVEDAVGRALLHAVSERREQAVAWILAHTAPPAGRLQEALQKAVTLNALPVIETLLRCSRVEVNALASDQPLTQLHRASERGRMQLVLMLLEHGADANAVDGVGLTPLHYAVKGSAVGVVEVLLERGADVDATSGLGTPFEAAVRRGWGQGVEAMARWGVEGWDLVAMWGFVKARKLKGVEEGFLRAVAEVYGEDVRRGLVEGRYG
jgi:ankyrin repeat protein